MLQQLHAHSDHCSASYRQPGSNHRLLIHAPIVPSFRSSSPSHQSASIDHQLPVHHQHQSCCFSPPQRHRAHRQIIPGQSVCQCLPAEFQPPFHQLPYPADTTSLPDPAIPQEDHRLNRLNQLHYSQRHQKLPHQTSASGLCSNSALGH